MKKKEHWTYAFLGANVLLLLGACAGGGGSSGSAVPGTEIAAAPLGAVIAGANGAERSLFDEGLAVFEEVEAPADGIGPVFNGLSCAECHSAGAVGGAGDNLGTHVVRRIGATVGGAFSELVDFGGPVLQSRSNQEFDPAYPVPPEVVPPQAQFVSRRMTTPLFGAGLIENISDATLMNLAAQPKPFGVRGRVNRVFNPLTNRTEIGKFGWKSQISTLDHFSADAYVQEMGITSTAIPTEVRPQGQSIPAGADGVGDPEDDTGEFLLFANYMRLLAPPAPTVIPDSAAALATFETIGCGSCHTQSLTTGTSSHPSLSNRVARLYSDLLIHNMGPGLADGIVQGDARSGDWRTAPLWGLSKRRFLLHDGRATSVEAAILAHGGEAQQVRDNYVALNPTDKDRLLRFLNSL